MQNNIKFIIIAQYKMRMKDFFFLALFLCASCQLSAQLPVPDSADLVIHHKYYWINYDEGCNIARYTFYRSYKKDITKPGLKRGDWFRRDPLIEGGTAKISLSPFDRGHLVPFDDMSFDSIAARESFFMSNIIPQESSLNRGLWSKLERQVRKLTMQYDSAYITTGTVFGIEARNTIKGICIPVKVYKVIFYYANRKWKSECYLIPNTKPAYQSIYAYKIGISQLSELAGIQFRE